MGNGNGLLSFLLHPDIIAAIKSIIKKEPCSDFFMCVNGLFQFRLVRPGLLYTVKILFYAHANIVVYYGFKTKLLFMPFRALNNFLNINHSWIFKYKAGISRGFLTNINIQDLA